MFERFDTPAYVHDTERYRRLADAAKAGAPPLGESPDTSGLEAVEGVPQYDSPLVGKGGALDRAPRSFDHPRYGAHPTEDEGEPAGAVIEREGVGGGPTPDTGLNLDYLAGDDHPSTRSGIAHATGDGSPAPAVTGGGLPVVHRRWARASLSCKTLM